MNACSSLLVKFRGFLRKALQLITLSGMLGAYLSPAQNPVNFASSQLKSAAITFPTSLQFGPDGRLYVSQHYGEIKIFTIEHLGPNNYQVTATETIFLIKNIPNHNDDGTLNPGQTDRQVTGLVVTGTASNPILYVSSSDPRVGGGETGEDKNLDTNSGMISKLTWTGSAWTKKDVVVGLPRSEENHAVNGMQLDAVNNMLYVATGGNTNAGSPSNNFAFLCEYALSAAILKIDLTRIETEFGGTYILPTLDDPTRPNTGPNGSDQNDPFGGNDGLNQAKLVPGGPVQIHSPGYRNPYDLVITKTPGKEGRMYVVDNGANQGWGGHPDQEGAFGNPLTTNVTNKYVPGEPGSLGPGPNDAIVNNKDGLHLVSKPGMDPIYAGHPNPIRANPAGAGWYWFNNATNTATYHLSPTADWPPVPESMANPVEGDFRNPGVDDGALYTWSASTNGITEYTSSQHFDGAMVGDLLVASFDGHIYRIKLNQAGTAVEFVESLASGFGAIPLDVVAQGTGEPFEGSVWIANYGSGTITVLEPRSGCDGIVDVTVIRVGNTLTATATGATYQWINCTTGLDIPGQTGKSFTATEIGSYAVRISKSGCTDVSACVDIDELQSTFVTRINAGGSQQLYGDELWEADQYFLNGSTYSTSAPISNTDKDELYQTERFAVELLYQIPVPKPGKYMVMLHFAEIFWSTTGSRVFDVDLEDGQAKLTNFDIVQAAGGSYKAVTRSLTADVNDGSVSLNFAGIVDQAKVSAIEVSLCAAPTIVSVLPTPATVCTGNPTTVTVYGSLGSATAWYLYTGSCGGTLVASNTTGIFEVSPTTNTTYYVRGEGGCSAPGTCASVSVDVQTVPATVTNSSGTLIATPAGASAYQWMDCGSNTNIAGETGRFFTPGGNGSFAVRVTMDGCTSTSACFPFSIVGLPDDPSDKIMVYPNPGYTSVKVELPFYAEDCRIQITDMTGIQVMAATLNNTNEIDLDIENLPRGVYLIHIRSEQLRKTLKLMIN